MVNPTQHVSELQDKSPQQESRILSLPAELRNQIYSYVVAEAEVHLHLNGTMKSGLPRLAAVSKQVYEELNSEYRATALRRASTFVIHIVDFVHELQGMGQPNLVNLVKTLGLANPDGWRHKITVRIQLTDDYHQHMQDLAKLVYKIVQGEMIKPKFEIRYDNSHFDDKRFLQLLESTRWGQCSAGLSPEMSLQLKKTYTSIKFAQLAEKERHRRIAEAELAKRNAAWKMGKTIESG